MSKKQVIIFLIIILLIGTFLRLYQLDVVPPGLYHDEAINGNNALEALENENYRSFYPENNGREGLYINLATVPLSIFGNESWALRGLSAIFGILTILGLFLLTKKLFNTRIALFASFFLATSFWHILFSRIGFRAIMAPFFLIWSFYFLFACLRRPAVKNKKTWHIMAILGGLLFGLGFHSYIAYRIAPLLLVVPFMILWKQKQKGVIALFLISAFIAGLPLGLYFLENPQDFLGRTSQISIFSLENPIQNLVVNAGKTIGMLFFIGDFNWRHNLSGAPLLWWPTAILFFIGVLVGFKKIISKLKRPSKVTGYWLLFVWSFVMMLPVVISNEGLPHALRAIILIPPIMIFAGLGLNWFVSKLPKTRRKLTILLFIFLFALTVNSFNQYFINWGQNYNTYNSFNGRYWDIGKYLQTLPDNVEKYVVVNTYGVLVDGIPMPAQTVMFATTNKNINYLLPEEINSIKCDKSCIIATLEPDGFLREKIKNQVPGLNIITKPGFEALIK